MIFRLGRQGADQGVPVDRGRAAHGHVGRVPGQRRAVAAGGGRRSRCTGGRAGRGRRSSCRSRSATGRVARRSPRKRCSPSIYVLGARLSVRASRRALRRSTAPAAVAASRQVTVRVGVDVGGTFTKAVAFDIDEGAGRRRSDRARRRTTIADGVAAGVVDVVAQLARYVGAAAVELVTHSTTQAVNALLEGDVAHRRDDRHGPGAGPSQGAEANDRTAIELSEGPDAGDRAGVPRRHRRARSRERARPSNGCAPGAARGDRGRRGVRARRRDQRRRRRRGAAEARAARHAPRPS